MDVNDLSVPFRNVSFSSYFYENPRESLDHGLVCNDMPVENHPLSICFLHTYPNKLLPELCEMNVVLILTNTEAGRT